MNITDVKTQLNALVTSQDPTLIFKHGKAVGALVPIELYKEMYNAYQSIKTQEAAELARQYFEGKKETVPEDYLKEKLEKI